MQGSGLGVERRNTGAVARLKVTGELDVSTAPGLEERLRDVTSRYIQVELDLSELDFIDLTGARAVTRALAAAWPDYALSLKPAPSEQARRLSDLVNLDQLVAAA